MSKRYIEVEPLLELIDDYIQEYDTLEDGRYLITGRRGTVYSLEYQDERWYRGIEPIAWMPLPAAYKSGDRK